MCGVRVFARLVHSRVHTTKTRRREKNATTDHTSFGSHNEKIDDDDDDDGDLQLSS